MADLDSAAATLARDPEEVCHWPRDSLGRIDLLTVVQQTRPTVLIGTSTLAGAFDQAVVTAMARHCSTPVILPLSNPTSQAEATPADLLAWTEGRALVGTGSPFDPVERPEGLRRIGQCNNCFLFPGLGFAAVDVGLRAISDGMIDAGLEALAAVAAAVADAVARTGVREGLAPPGVREEAVRSMLEQARWMPRYSGQPVPPLQA